MPPSGVAALSLFAEGPLLQLVVAMRAQAQVAPKITDKIRDRVNPDIGRRFVIVRLHRPVAGSDSSPPGRAVKQRHRELAPSNATFTS
jgi:hypothetical protein